MSFLKGVTFTYGIFCRGIFSFHPHPLSRNTLKFFPSTLTHLSHSFPLQPVPPPKTHPASPHRHLPLTHHTPPRRSSLRRAHAPRLDAASRLALTPRRSSPRCRAAPRLDAAPRLAASPPCLASLPRRCTSLSFLCCEAFLGTFYYLNGIYREFENTDSWMACNGTEYLSKLQKSLEGFDCKSRKDLSQMGNDVLVTAGSISQDEQRKSASSKRQEDWKGNLGLFSVELTFLPEYGWQSLYTLKVDSDVTTKKIFWLCLDRFIPEPVGTEKNLLVAYHENRQDLILDRLSESEKEEYEAARCELLEEVASGTSVQDLCARFTNKTAPHYDTLHGDTSHNLLVGQNPSPVRTLHSHPQVYWIPLFPVCSGCHMPTSFRLVHPRTTPYWVRGPALIPFVTPLTFDIPAVPHYDTLHGDTSHNLLVGHNPSPVRTLHSKYLDCQSLDIEVDDDTFKGMPFVILSDGKFHPLDYC
ncbi:hypothetical protein Fmac_006606 [Flemingia macrophylla]|uniref:DUF7067 domain-containing protein n=1 Tax=Flemingia macrophylla TaxID=520843 RepID=A0ABD1NB30_9FABA